jgi:Lectin C-type domain
MMLRAQCAPTHAGKGGGKMMKMQQNNGACRPPTNAPTTGAPVTGRPTGSPSSAPSSAPTADDCEGAFQHTNGHKYAQVNVERALYWEDAKAEAEGLRCCGGVRGHLATVSDADENAAVAGVLIPRAWFGLREYSSEKGPFQWVDGTPFSYGSGNFVTPVADATLECGAINSDGEWLGYACNSTTKKTYVVEFDCV